MRVFPALVGFVAAAALAACATDPETDYGIQAVKAEYRDGYRAGKRACETQNGLLVVDGYMRPRDSTPDFRSRYWCSRR